MKAKLTFHDSRLVKAEQNNELFAEQDGKKNSLRNLGAALQRIIKAREDMRGMSAAIPTKTKKLHEQSHVKRALVGATWASEPRQKVTTFTREVDSRHAELQTVLGLDGETMKTVR